MKLMIATSMVITFPFSGPAPENHLRSKIGFHAALQKGPCCPADMQKLHILSHCFFIDSAGIPAEAAGRIQDAHAAESWLQATAARSPGRHRSVPSSAAAL